MDFTKYVNGSTIPHIYFKDYKEEPFPYSQLIEQQRIVSILDEAFAALDQAKDNLQRNVQNAKDLFQSELNQIFMQKGDDWVEKKLEKVLQKTETINPLNQPNKEYIYIDVSSVNKESLLIEETSLIKGENAPSRARKLIKTNDVIFATVRPTLKRIAIITENYNEQICSTGYFVLRAAPIIHYGLLFYYLQTIDFQDNMKVLQKGANYPAVTDGQIREQIIAFPKDKKEQQRIVERLDALSAETQTLKKAYEQKLLYIETLKKSLLQKAFSGDL
jgi:type I restriction enzyme S subunit